MAKDQYKKWINGNCTCTARHRGNPDMSGCMFTSQARRDMPIVEGYFHNDYNSSLTTQEFLASTLEEAIELANKAADKLNSIKF